MSLNNFLLFFLDVKLLAIMLQEIQYCQASSCSKLSTEDLTEYGKTHRYRNGIPKIIHYVYRSSYIPYQYTPHVQLCMLINNDAKFVFWSDFSAYRFMLKLNTKYIDMYSSYFEKVAISIKLSDVIRYFILLEFGGVYMDLDTKCVKPFEAVFVNDSCILSRENEEQSQILYNVEYLAMNSLMACVPGHQFFQYLVDNLKMSDSSWVVQQTGPLFLTMKYKEYSKNQTLQDSEDHLKLVKVADSYTFSPFAETYYYKYCVGNIKGEWKIKGCKNLPRRQETQRIKQNESVAVHLYMHLGYSYRFHLIQNMDHFCHFSTFGNVVWT